MDTPPLTRKTVEASGPELYAALEILKRDGYKVTMLVVKGVCDYTVTAIYDWNKPQQQELLT